MLNKTRTDQSVRSFEENLKTSTDFELKLYPITFTE